MYPDYPSSISVDCCMSLFCWPGSCGYRGLMFTTTENSTEVRPMLIRTRRCNMTRPTRATEYHSAMSSLWLLGGHASAAPHLLYFVLVLLLPVLRVSIAFGAPSEAVTSDSHRGPSDGRIMMILCRTLARYMVRGWYERIQDMRGLADVQSILTLASKMNRRRSSRRRALLASRRP